jgi:Zn-dependent protease with chaperone function
MLRVLSAILLMIGFYVLALGVAFGLLAASYFSVAAGHIYPRLVFIAAMTAGVILWSIVPRFDKFSEPGPRLTAGEQLELFALVREVAAATNEAMPAAVYLVPDVNAYVANRGGIAGLGSRRIMGVGLPLLQMLTVSQLRAVLAHEFGHYAAGDLKLGAWVYRTRAAMARTIQNLGRTGSAWVHEPFLAYGNLFMRVTQAIARGQELAADRMAVRVAGARNHAEALRVTHGAGAAFGAYWTGEVVPLLSNGWRPPIGAGFAQFVRADRVAQAIATKLDEELKSGAADPYDSHPSLKDRLSAIGDAIGDAPDASPLHDAPAISLIRDLGALERELLELLGGPPELKPVEWDETPQQVYIPVWRAGAKQVAGVFANATAADVPRLFPSNELAEALGVRLLSADERRPQLQSAVGMVVAAKLIDDGWTCTTSPGEEIVLTKDGRSFRPFIEASRSGDEWLAAVREAGIETLPLG